LPDLQTRLEDAFLTLMLAQLKHQDPMKPMENGEFLSQMAEFSTVTGIEEMNASLETLTTSIGTNRTLEAASLIGREVIVEDDQLSLGDGNTGVGGRFSLDGSSGDVSLDVYGPDGTLVRRQAMGQFEGGEHAFTWDGLNDKGEAAAAGDYTASTTTRLPGSKELAPTLLTYTHQARLAPPPMPLDKACGWPRCARSSPKVTSDSQRTISISP